MGAIHKHDPESRYRAWSTQLQRAENIAREAVRNFPFAAARRAFLWSANYARASGYILIGPDARILQAAERSVALFRKAVPYLEGKVVDVEIPYRHQLDDRAIMRPGYFYLPPSSKRVCDRKASVLINCGGAGCMKEELYFAFPITSVERSGGRSLCGSMF